MIERVRGNDDDDDGMMFARVLQKQRRFSYKKLFCLTAKSEFMENFFHLALLLLHLLKLNYTYKS